MKLETIYRQNFSNGDSAFFLPKTKSKSGRFRGRVIEKPAGQKAKPQKWVFLFHDPALWRIATEIPTDVQF